MRNARRLCPYGQVFAFTQIGSFSVPSAGQHDDAAGKRVAHEVQGHVVHPTAGAYALQPPSTHTSFVRHVRPQAPQFCGSVFVLTHEVRPNTGHAVLPVEQVAAHLPPSHAVAAPTLQLVPHAPQANGLLLRSAHCEPMNGNVQTVVPGRQLQVPLPSQY